MPLVDLSDVLNHVLAEVRLAPEELALQKLRERARDFCQITRAWQADAAAKTIAINTATYTIVSPIGEAEPVAIEYLAVATVADTPVEAEPKSREWLDRSISNWRTRAADDFRYFTQLTRSTFTFPGLPVVAGLANGLTYRLSLKPGPEGTEIDEDVWSEFYEVLATGAKAELLVMDGERWANVKRGADYRQQYIVGRTHARIKVSRGYSDSEDHVVSPYRFGGR